MVEEKISFACQRCLEPVRIDDSLNLLGEHIQAELLLPIHFCNDTDLESHTTSFDNYINPCRLSDSGNAANGFMVISDGVEADNFSKKMEVSAAMFDVLSGNSNIDHPLCEECTDTLLEYLKEEVRLVEIDCIKYSQHLQILEYKKMEPKLSDLEKEFQDLVNEEEQVMKELENLQQEGLAIKEAILEQEKSAEKLSLEENKYWMEFTRHRKDQLDADDELKSIECQLSYSKNQLEKLTKTNVFNATFHIWHAGHFGTINNLRLGRLPASPVDWSEINAAWGQATLLLAALARKINLTFDKYVLVPYGNHSYIQVIKDQRELPLYGAGGFKFYWDTKFDSGMAAFMDCLQQFKDEVQQQKGEKAFSLPYKMSKGKIEDATTSYSIKIQFNSEEQWTKALKFLLTNLKWSLAWVSSQFTSEGDPID